MPFFLRKFSVLQAAEQNSALARFESGIFFEQFLHNLIVSLSLSVKSNVVTVT